MTQPSPIRRRMIKDMTIRNLSPANRQSYLYAVSSFSRFFNRSPDQLTLQDMRTYQVHLTSRVIAWSSLNKTVGGSTLLLRDHTGSSAPKSGRGQVSAPIFLPVPRVRLYKRLNLTRDAQKLAGAKADCKEVD